MNLPTDPNQSPSVDELLPPPTAPEVAARQAELAPVKAKQPPFKVIGIVAASLIGFGLLAAAGNSDNDKHDDTSSGTGNSSVDAQIVETVWDSMKAEICPAFDAAKASLPGLSEGEVYDMGVGLADMGDMTPAQLTRLRELALADC